MPILLIFMFLAMGFGLATNRAGMKESALILLAAMGVAVIYYAFPRLV